MKLNIKLPFRPLQILLFGILTLAVFYENSAAQDLRIYKGAKSNDPVCTAVLRPIETTPNQSDVLLRFTSKTGQDISISAVKSASIEKVELVYGDMRMPFPRNLARTKNQLEKSPLWKALKTTGRFHLTAWLSNGKIRSSRFENFDGAAILAAMETRCNFALPDSLENSFQDVTDLTPGIRRLAIWALNRLEGEHREFLQLPATLTAAHRAELKRFQSENELPNTGNLDRETISLVLSKAGIAIAPLYSDISRFSNGRAAVKFDELWGQIDKSGNWISKPIYQATLPSDGIAIPFLQSRRWIALDQKGKRVPGFLQDNLLSCSQNWCVTKSGSTHSLVSLVDRKRVAQKFDKISPFSNGLALASNAGNWYRIDEEGAAQIWRGTAHAIKNHWQNRIAVQRKEGGKWQLMTLDGAPLGSILADEIWQVSEGLIKFRISNRFGFMSARDGTVEIEPQFTGAGSFASGLAPAKSGRKWGYVDRAGRWIIEPQFTFAAEFSQTLALIKDDRGLAGFINTRGDMILPPQFSDATSFSDKRAAFLVDGLWGFLDRRALIATRQK